MGSIVGKAAFDAQNVEELVPHGDRLLVEKIDVEDAQIVAGAFDVQGRPQRIVIQRAEPARDPRDTSPRLSPEQLLEIARGWILCRVVSAGSGHRLEMDMTVPMPFKRGDYVYVERLAQHGLEFQGVKYYIISQIDVLLLAPQIKHLASVPALNVVPLQSEVAG